MTTKTTLTSGDEPENVPAGALFVATAGIDRGTWWTRDPENSPLPVERPWRITKLGAGSGIQAWWESDSVAVGARLARLTTLHPDAPAEYRAFEATHVFAGGGDGSNHVAERIGDALVEAYDQFVELGIFPPRDAESGDGGGARSRFFPRDFEADRASGDLGGRLPALDPDNPQDCRDLADLIEQFARADANFGDPAQRAFSAVMLRARADRIDETLDADERLSRVAQALYCNQTVRRTHDDWERLDTKLRAVWYDRARAALHAADDDEAAS